jgi:hypothetical protein
LDVQTPAVIDGEWGGMYVATLGANARPYYGYAAGSDVNARTYYDGATNDWIVRNSIDCIVVESSGQVGIGTNEPAYLLEVDGTAGKPGGGSWSNSSDLRLKKNVANLDGALKSLLRLRGVTFEYKDPDSINELGGQRIGMIAQEVESVFPDWVDERPDGYKSVTFRGFEALTIEALRELHSEKERQMADVRAENAKLSQLVADQDAKISNLRQQLDDMQQQVSQILETQVEER